MRLEESLAGGALAGPERLFTWGDSVREWSVRGLDSRVIASGPTGEGGCVTDLDGDGQRELIVVQGSGLGRLVWLERPDWHVETIDSEVEMHDCLEATLFGRRGFLMIQRGIQVRFYERSPAGKWSSRDIYSIYTPSYQGGLALADVDNDGRTDIYCGNYWIQSPARFELPWRLFAINTWSEDQDSATFRIVPMSPGTIAVSQAHMANAKVAVFTRPRDPKQQWPVRLIAPEKDLSNVHGLALWNDLLLAGEKNGSGSQLLRIDTKSWHVEVIGTGKPVVSVLPLDASHFLAIGTNSVTLWSQPSRK